MTSMTSIHRDVLGQRSPATWHKFPGFSRYAFLNCYQLVLVIIRGSVTHIGDGAFAGRTSLASITLPKSLRYTLKALKAESMSRSLEIPTIRATQGKKRSEWVWEWVSEWVSEKSSLERSFVLQAAQNHGKRFTELPQFKSDTLQHLEIQFMLGDFVCKQCMWYVMLLAAI